jgi:hypothetical protein
VFKGFVDQGLMVLLIRVITICKHVRYFMGFQKLGNFTIGLFLQQFKSWGTFHFCNPSKFKTRQNHLFWMLSWCRKMGLGMEAKTRWQLRLHTSPIFLFLSFCKVNEWICKFRWNGTYNKICSFNKMWKIYLIKNHFKHTWYSLTTYKPFSIGHFCKLRLVVLMSFDLI